LKRVKKLGSGLNHSLKQKKTSSKEMRFLNLASKQLKSDPV